MLKGEEMVNNVNRLLYALELKKIDRPPVVGLMTSVTLDLMENSGIYWPEAHHDYEKMVKLAAAAFEYYGLESLKLPFDMAVEVEALGGEIDFGNKETLPQVIGHLYHDPEEFIFDREVLKKGRIQMILKAIKYAKKNYGDAIPVFSSIVGPFTLGTKLFGFENFLEWIILEPEKIKKCLEKTTDLCIMYAKEQVRAGCDVVQIGEASASGDLISGECYGQFIAPCHKRLCSEIEAPTVVHICGDITGHLKHLLNTSMSGISIDEKTNIREAINTLKGKVAVVGYIPTLDTLLIGTPEDVYKKSEECLKAGVDVLNAGCAWPPHIKPDNIKAMVKASKVIRI